jgi:hypothetical protein
MQTLKQLKVTGLPRTVVLESEKYLGLPYLKD